MAIKRKNAAQQAAELFQRVQQGAGQIANNFVRNPVVKSVGNAVINTNPILHGLNSIRQSIQPSIPQIRPQVQNFASQLPQMATNAFNTYKNTPISINRFMPNSPFNVIPQQFQPKVTPSQLFNNVVAPTWREPAKFGGGVALSAGLGQTPTGRKQSFYQPDNPVSKFVFGNEPVKNIQGQGQDLSKTLQGLGIEQKTANKAGLPLVVGLGLTNFAGGGGKTKIIKELEPSVNMLRKVLSSKEVYLVDEFMDWVGKTGGKSEKAMEAIDPNTLRDIHAMTSAAFGNEAKTWTNKKIVKAWQYAFKRLTESKGTPVGLSINDVSENFAKEGKVLKNEALPEAKNAVKAVNPEWQSIVDSAPPNTQTVGRTAQDYTLPSTTTQAERMIPAPKPETSQYAQAFESTQDILGRKQQQARVGEPFERIINSHDINVKQKVNLLDYFRTPDRVLQKVGLGDEAKLIRQKYEDYLKELPENIRTITNWASQVPKESNQRIFQYLDGQPIQLDPTELKVATEIKEALKVWADRLKLPQDRRISNYITHLFDKELIAKEFDPELARLIRDKIPGSVYDPFVQERLGKLGYIEDTWGALDAYVKRATRKVHMDEALEKVAAKADMLEDSQFKYVKSYVDRINMRPTSLDNLIDNGIKSVIGYKLGQRPVTAVTRGLRQMVYRGTLGLNVGSALRNLSQGVNTYAKLGEKYTIKGYIDMVKNFVTKSDELQRVGVLKDDFIQDRAMNATKQAWEKADKKLFYLFEMAEKINRGSAYFGAKAKALADGLSDEQAIEAGKKMVRDTQFTFGSVDTPQILQSDLAKTLLQFQSYNLKQGEFLAEMVKNKEVAGLVRYSAASMAFLLSAGQLIGMKPTDFIPFWGVLTGQTKLGETPPVKLGKDIAGTLAGSKDQYGNEQDTQDRINTFGKDLVPFIPGGVQIKKTVEGLLDTKRGYDTTPTGKVKFPIGQSTGNYIRAGAFGTNNLSEAQDYYNNKRSPLGENQSADFKELGPTDRKEFINSIYQNREQKKQEEQSLEPSSFINQAGASEGIDNSREILKRVSSRPPLQTPRFTGQPNLDKSLLSKYSSQINTRKNDVRDLVEMGKLTPEQGERLLSALEEKLDGVKTSQEAQKTYELTGDPVIDKTIKSRQKAAITAQINQIVDYVQEGKLTAEQGRSLIDRINAKNNRSTGGSRQKRKVNYNNVRTTAKSISVPTLKIKIPKSRIPKYKPIKGKRRIKYKR